MTPERKRDAPDPPKPTTKAYWRAEALKLRAIIDERDLADAAREAATVADLSDDDPENPARCYLLIAEAAYQAVVPYKTAWALYKAKRIYGFKVAGTSKIKLCRNDLIDWRLKTGRHGKPA